MELITLTVNTTIDENDGREAGTGLSLRDAIAIANESPENNYIIELEGGATYNLNVDSGDPGDNHLDLGGNGNVTIRGIGNERAVIDASSLENPDIVLHIYNNANVNLENLTITGGVAEGNDQVPGVASGGGLFITDNSTVTITNSLVTNNSAASTGGGIFAGEETTVTLINSEVSDNQSNFNGGGILTTSNNFTIRSSKITGNSVVDGPPSDKSGRGGGIVVRGGTTNILDTTIDNNTSLFDGGGGIAVTNAEVNIYSSTISNNTSGSSGAGIEVENDSELQPVVTIVNSTISGNVADYVGGGVYLDYFSFIRSGNDPVVFITNSTIANNTANANLDEIFGGAGGGIATGQNNRIAVTNSIVTGNIDGRDNSPSDVSGFFYTDLFFMNSERGILGDGNNIIGTLDRVRGTIGTGSDLVGVDPLLSPLEDNGNGRLVIPLSENSPAIDGGNNQFVPADFFDLDGDGNREERVPLNGAGSDRIINDIVDIGAVEFGSTLNSPNNNSSNIVYRFLNNDTGVHFYTANITERDVVLELDNFSFEGGSYQGVDPLTGMPEPLPVYRFLNQDTGVHLYTISEIERDATQELNNFSFEGEAFFAYATEVENSIPIYRFFNSTTGAHFYTPSEAEKNNVEANLPEFQGEGIAYYVLPFNEEDRFL